MKKMNEKKIIRRKELMNHVIKSAIENKRLRKELMNIEVRNKHKKHTK